jgi:hypothetical protein
LDILSKLWKRRAEASEHFGGIRLNAGSELVRSQLVIKLGDAGTSFSDVPGDFLIQCLGREWPGLVDPALQPFKEHPCSSFEISPAGCVLRAKHLDNIGEPDASGKCAVLRLYRIARMQRSSNLCDAEGAC